MNSPLEDCIRLYVLKMFDALHLESTSFRLRNTSQWKSPHQYIPVVSFLRRKLRKSICVVNNLAQYCGATQQDVRKTTSQQQQDNKTTSQQDNKKTG